MVIQPKYLVYYLKRWPYCIFIVLSIFNTQRLYIFISTCNAWHKYHFSRLFSFDDFHKASPSRPPPPSDIRQSAAAAAAGGAISSLCRWCLVHRFACQNERILRAVTATAGPFWLSNPFAMLMSVSPFPVIHTRTPRWRRPSTSLYINIYIIYTHSFLRLFLYRVYSS